MSKTEGDDMAFSPYLKDDRNYVSTTCFGLTKREYIAALAMQGALANPERMGNTREMAEASVMWADALLNELAKETK